MLAIADRGGIEVDYCPVCRGVWLDRGELDKLIERQNQVIAQSVPSRLPGYKEAWGAQDPPAAEAPGRRSPLRDDDEEYRRRKRKKSPFDLLEDIFDF
jgi:Zn-finger nucleic acid-binding protein